MTTDTTPPRPRSVRASAPAPAASAAPATAPTPSQEVTAGASAAPVAKHDSRGRSLKIRKLGTVQHMRISRVLGAELSKNEAYRGLASLAFCVTEIDGEAIAPPVNVREIEHMVERLGDDGVAAIGDVYREQGWVKADEDDAGVIEDAKN